MSDITYFAQTNFRNQNHRFGIKQSDRFSHTFVIGKTGTGKTTLLKTKIEQDITNGNGFAVFDPHGDLAESVVGMIPAHKKKDLIYFDTPNPSLDLLYNPLKRVSPEKRALVASGLIETLRKQFGASAWGVGMEHILRNCLLTLLDQERADLSDILKLLNNKAFRSKCIDQIQNQTVKDFWIDEYNKYPPFTRQAAIRPIQNKIGAYLSNPTTKRVLVDNKNSVSLRQAMDSNKIIVINLSKGKIGDDASHLLGGLLITAMGLAAYSRADQPEETREPFFIYCDEFQNFTTLFLVSALSELRKFKIGLVLVTQYLSQLDKKIEDAILGNAGTLIVFRLGAIDAAYFSREFDHRFAVGDITHLPNYQIYLRLMIDGKSGAAFSGKLCE